MKNGLIFFSFLHCLLIRSGNKLSEINVRMNQQEATIKQIWMLKNGDLKSPWNVKIVPAFLDFVSTPHKLILRGRSDSSLSEYSYTINNNEILTNKAKFKIIALSLNNLVLKMGEDYYSYYPLKKNIEKIDETFIFNTLTSNKRWVIGSDTIQFTKSDDIDLFNIGPKFYKLDNYKENRKFYGTYNIDVFQGHVFLYFLIDGEYKERVYEIIKVSDKAINYKEIGSENIIEGFPAVF